MAIIRKKEIKALTKAEIEKKAESLRIELAREKSAAFVGGSVKNPGRIREMRRTLARMSTILSSPKTK